MYAAGLLFSVAVILIIGVTNIESPRNLNIDLNKSPLTGSQEDSSPSIQSEEEAETGAELSSIQIEHGKDSSRKRKENIGEICYIKRNFVRRKYSETILRKEAELLFANWYSKIYDDGMDKIKDIVGTVDELKHYNLICRPVVLEKIHSLHWNSDTSREPILEMAIVKFLTNCENVLNEMVKRKLELLLDVGDSMSEWMNMLAKFVKDKQSMERLEVKNIRNDNDLKVLLLNTITKSKTSLHTLDAYLYGYGICHHATEPPVDFLEDYVTNLFSYFKDLLYVEKVKMSESLMVKFYLLQIVCKRLKSHPIDEKDILTLPSSFEEPDKRREVFVKANMLKLDRLPECIKQEVHQLDWVRSEFNQLSAKTKQRVVLAHGQINHFIQNYFQKCAHILDTRRKPNPFIHEREFDRNLTKNTIRAISASIMKESREKDLSMNQLADVRRDPTFFINHIKNSLQSAEIKIESLYTGDKGPCKDILSKELFKDIKLKEFDLIEFWSYFAGLKFDVELEGFSVTFLQFHLAWKSCESAYLLPFEESEKFNYKKKITEMIDPSEGSIPKHDVEHAKLRIFFLALRNLHKSGQLRNPDVAQLQTSIRPYVCSGDGIKKVAENSFLGASSSFEFLINNFLMNCELYWEGMIKAKLEHLGDLGSAVKIWMKIISDNFRASDTNKLLEPPNPRIDTKLREDLERSFALNSFHQDSNALMRQKYMKAAYYWGDGICFHMMQLPTRNIRGIVASIYFLFREINFASLLASSSSLLSKTYLFLSACENLAADPVGYTKESILPSKSLGSLAKFVDEMMEFTKSGVGSTQVCDWESAVRLKFLINETRQADQTTQELVDDRARLFVKYCLTKFKSESRNYKSVLVKNGLEGLFSIRRSLTKYMQKRLEENSLAAKKGQPPIAISEMLDMRPANSYFWTLVSNAQVGKEEYDKMFSFVYGRDGICKGLYVGPFLDSDRGFAIRSFEFVGRLTTIAGIEQFLPKNKGKISISGILRAYIIWRACESLKLQPIDQSDVELSVRTGLKGAEKKTQAHPQTGASHVEADGVAEE